MRMGIQIKVVLIAIKWKSDKSFENILAEKVAEKCNTANATLEINPYEDTYDGSLDDLKGLALYQVAIMTNIKAEVAFTVAGNRTYESLQLPLPDPQNTYYYILKSDCWNENVNSYLCPSYNTPGDITATIKSNGNNDHTITIKINRELYDQMNEAFEGDLWKLITYKKSLIGIPQIQKQNIYSSTPNPDHIKQFVRCFQAVARRPKTELRMTSGQAKASRARPSTEAIRKLLCNPATPIVPSRLHIESSHIYENRAACAMLDIVNRILPSSTKLLTREESMLNANGNKLKTTLKRLCDHAKDVIQTPPCPPVSPPLQSYSFSGRFPNSNGYSKFWSQANSNSWGVLSFDDVILDAVCADSSIQSLTFSCKEPVTSSKTSQKNNSYKSYTFTPPIYVPCANTRAALIKAYQKKAKSSEAYLMAKAEEAEILANQKASNQDLAALKELEPTVQQLVDSPFYHEHRPTIGERISPTMTFLQNPLYAELYRTFQNILNDCHLTTEAIDFYEESVSVGMRILPKIYELWCLIKIINTLREEFLFEPTENPVPILQKAIRDDKEKINSSSTFEFARPNVLSSHEQRSGAGNAEQTGSSSNDIPNWYQNHKLRLHFQRKDKLFRQNQGNSFTGLDPDYWIELLKVGENDTQDTVIANLILDAKCKVNCEPKECEMVVYDDNGDPRLRGIYNKYAQYAIPKPCTETNPDIYKNNSVFALFPKLKGSSNIGGLAFSDNKFPDHRYGYLALFPDDDEYLRKVLWMTFILGPLEDNYGSKKNGGPYTIESKATPLLFCVKCGAALTTIEGKKKNWYYCSNSDCVNAYKSPGKGQPEPAPKLVLNHCWNSSEHKNTVKGKVRVLFKQGPGWSFHEPHEDNPFNVRCPECGASWKVRQDRTEDDNYNG